MKVYELITELSKLPAGAIVQYGRTFELDEMCPEGNNSYSIYDEITEVDDIQIGDIDGDVVTLR